MQATLQTIFGPVFISCIAAVFGAIANWLFKRAALQFVEVPIWKNWQLALGLLSFTLVLGLFMFAFRSGGRLMTVYPAYATTYVWALVIAHLVDGESISLVQIGGILAVIAGVAAIGIGAKA
jgi:drug/metabolite transporter (DMT)-like permease